MITSALVASCADC